MSVYNLKEIIGKALFSGVTASGLSYFVLKRNDLIEAFGVEMSHYMYDGEVTAISSAVADFSTVYILPFLENHLNGGQKFSTFIDESIGPILTGTSVVLGNKFAIEPQSTEPMKDFLLGAGSKLAGDRVYTALWGWI